MTFSFSFIGRTSQESLSSEINRDKKQQPSVSNGLKGGIPSDDGERETNISGSTSPLNTSEIIEDSFGSDGLLVIGNDGVDLVAVFECIQS